MNGKGCYLYGVAESDRAVSLGQIGIEGSDVYSVMCGSMCALVHNCSAEPYCSSEEQTVRKWVLAHQSVLDEAKAQFGCVIPFRFDTIIQAGEGDLSPVRQVEDWLKLDYETLRMIMDRIKGKNEYGVQIFYNPAETSGQVPEDNLEICKLREEIATSTPGKAYLLRLKMEKMLKSARENRADDLSQGFYKRIKPYCEDVAIEKTKRAEGEMVMLLNLSCLVKESEACSLGAELGKIDITRGCSVRFTGPWPPYSFVSGLVNPAGRKQDEL